MPNIEFIIKLYQFFFFSLSAFTFSKLAIETLGQDIKYVKNEQ